MTNRPDAELVRLSLEGAHDAYKELVARYQGHVYGLAYSLVGDWHQAQDVAQETFIRAYGHLGFLREPAKFAAWLRRVAFSVTMNWIKAHRPGLFQRLDGRVDLDFLEVPDFKPGPAEVAAKRDLADAVMQAVGTLPSKYRVPLTMFHLDGLSYEKVAQFLDIPLGTAKSLIHRARAKLKAILATTVEEDITPMVQDVFDEHKLNDEFAKRVLEGIGKLDYRTTGETTFAGSVVACMKYLGTPTTYDHVMGVSGGAFKLLWHMPSGCPSNNSMGILGEEPRRQTFRALGYEYELVARTDCGTDETGAEEEFRQRIMASVDKGRPVIAWGIIGPPEECVVAGYDRDGDVLLGRSYFHDGPGYYEKTDWYKDCYGLLLIGDRTDIPPRSQILREALEWAVQLARTPSSADVPTAHEGRANGLAAYDAWAEALRRDEDFPLGDLEKLTFRCLVSNSVTLRGLLDARVAAAQFLKGMTDVAGAAQPDLDAAAAAFKEEEAVLRKAVPDAPCAHGPEKGRLAFADPERRARLAEHILAAKEKYSLAVEHIERALDHFSGE